MRVFKYLFLTIIVITSCKSNKTMTDSDAIVKNLSAKKVSKKHNAVNFDKNTADARLKVNFKSGKVNQSLSVSMKMIKDEVIWLKGTKLITVFKAKITPTSVSYYSPLAKNYFEGDFSLIKDLLGVEINFQQLQNLFLGQALLDLKNEKQDIQIVDNQYLLSPKNQNSLFDIFFAIDPSHFKLNKQFLVNSEQNLRLDVAYPSYNKIDGELFPSQINIKAKNSKSSSKISLVYREVEFNKDVSMSFRIPRNYKQLSF